jgi:hypothetical protein
VALRRVRPLEATAVTYSYQGQDLFVVEVLGGLRGGFFLDSGASNGVDGSNTRLLETAYGWQGVCVEPNERLFRQLVANRSCTCIDRCLYDHEGTVDFLEAAEVYGGIVAEYDPGLLRFARGVAGGAAPVAKRATTVRAVLEAAGAPPVIDYWSLDTEGSELALLRSFPFDAHHLRVLTVEHNDTPARSHIRRFLEARGYTWARTLGIDDAYVWTGAHATPAWRSRAWR